MSITMEIKKHPTYNCFEEVMSAVSEYYGLNIDFYFLSTFGFKYYINNDEMLSLNSADINNGGNNKELLERYSGLGYKIMETGDINPREFINEKISAHEPACVITDSFYLPWNPYYKRLNREHMFIITGRDGENYVCADPFFNEGRVLLNKSVMFECCYGYVDFEVRKDIVKPSLPEALDSLKLYMSSNKHAHVEDMKRFAKDMTRMRLPPDECEKYRDMNSSDLLFSLAALGWCRINFKDTVESFSHKHKTNVFADTASLLNDAIKLWSKTKGMLIKSVYSGNPENFLSKTGQLIMDISAVEDEVMESILCIQV